MANELRRLLALPAPDPPLLIDPDLRPEGRQGPLVRTLASYRAYYSRWSSPWESQALLRARFSAGDAELGATFIAVIDELRYPAGGITDDAVRDIRRLKARMEAERLPRGADPALHTKLGPGGLSDVEWVAQLLQLRHAGTTPALRTTRTLEALRAAVADGVDPADETAWRGPAVRAVPASGPPHRWSRAGQATACPPTPANAASSRRPSATRRTARRTSWTTTAAGPAAPAGW